MAEILTNSPNRNPRLEFNGIRVECLPDGAIIVFVPPEAFKVTTLAGNHGGGQSGRLYTQVLIAPLLDQERASRPTQTGLS